MIFAFQDILQASMRDEEFVSAMQLAIAKFQAYRSSIPAFPQTYSRTLLRKTARYELVAMRWAPAALTPIHDHGNSRCWVAMLEGWLAVENYEREDDGFTRKARLTQVSESRLNAGELDHRLTWRDLHRVRNESGAPAFSLQLYAAPQDEFSIIDEKTGECTRARPCYDSTFDL